MIDPLQLWQSPGVTNLLTDFYKANFDKAGSDPQLAETIVQTGWAKKDITNEKELMLELNEYFKEVKRQAHTGITEVAPTDFFDYSHVHTYLDYGANKLRVLNDVGYKYPNISKLIAVDVVPQTLHFAYPKRSEYIQIQPDASNLNLPVESVDFINIQFVMHHIEESLFDSIFNTLTHILKPGGVLVLREETFENTVNVDELFTQNLQIGIEMDKEFTRKFYNLSTEQRWEFIIVNDWLVNVNNQHMQWTGSYKTWDEWVSLLSKYDLKLQQTFNLGLRLNGILKQGVHVVGAFRKSKI